MLQRRGMVGSVRHVPTMALAVLLGACASSPHREAATAPTPGGWLCYERATPVPTSDPSESAKVPIVLVSGGQLGMAQWDRVFGDLAQEFEVVRYDPRGFGLSAPTGEPYRHDQDLVALLDHLGWTRVHVVGCSLGGRIAVDLARAEPARVAALTLLAPGLGGWPWSEAHDASFAAIGAAVAARDAKQAARLWLEHDYMAPAMRDPELAPLLSRLAEENAGLWIRTQSEVSDARTSAHATLQGAPLKTPGSILVGRHDVDDIHQIVEFLHATCPNLAKRPVEDSGHMLALETPAAVLAAVREDHRQ